MEGEGGEDEGDRDVEIEEGEEEEGESMSPAGGSVCCTPHYRAVHAN